MMTIAKAVSAALLAAAALGGASVASAACDPTTCQTDLLVAVWNPNTSTSFVQDLGTAYSQLSNTSTFESSAGFSTSWTIDGGNLATDLGSAGTGTYLFSVFAADYFTSPSQFAGSTAYLSLAAGGTIPQLTNGDIVNNVIGNTGSITTYMQANLPTTTTSVKGTGTSYWASSPSGPGVQGGSFTLPALANKGGTSVSNALNLIQYVGQNPDVAGTNVVASAVGNSANRGLFTVSGSTLNYNLAAAVSGVPLPAAGWLLVSGLLGLGAVGRRRNAAAANAA